MKSVLGNYMRLFRENITILLQVIFSFLLPIKALIILVGAMIILDTITGIWKAKKKKEPITSHKLSAIISKMLLYQLGLITFFVLDKYLLGEFLTSFVSISYFLTKIVAVFFCGIELMSINENIKVIYNLNFFQLFKQIVLRIKDVKQDITDISQKP